MPRSRPSVVFFFNDTATTEIYTLSLHDALPISHHDGRQERASRARRRAVPEEEARAQGDRETALRGGREAQLGRDPSQLERIVSVAHDCPLRRGPQRPPVRGGREHPDGGGGEDGPCAA